MRRAIALAQVNLGRTGDNPSVGCVLVNGGEVVGEGATGEGGRPHAEEVALQQAGSRARGATAFVTLEPCAERSTGQSSCSERLVAAGAARVVIACEDPSVLAAGRGVRRMREAGVACEIGLMQVEAYALYHGYRPRGSETAR